MKPRQQKIMKLLAQGFTQKEVAAKMNTTPTSINNRLKYLRVKHGKRTVIELVVDYALKEIA